jgi:hypothetical protein
MPSHVPLGKTETEVVAGPAGPPHPRADTETVAEPLKPEPNTAETEEPDPLMLLPDPETLQE